MKKLNIFFIFVVLFCLAFALGISAETVYLEEIPDELKAEDDTFTHFVVFEEEKYFTGSGGTISGLNSDVMDTDMAAASIDKSKIGTTYLTRFNFPAYMGENLVTYVNLNSMKTHNYFKNVCGYVQLEGTVNKVHDMNECVSQLRCVDFGENSQVTVIPLCFANNATRMASVKNFPRNLTSIGNSAFDRCYGAFRGELYVNAETIGTSAFNNAISNVTHLILGPKVKSIGTQAFTVLFAVQHHNEIPTFYAPADLKPALVSIEFQCDVSKISYATQGNNSGVFYFPVSTGRAPYEKLTAIILSHPDNAKYVTEGSIFNDFTAEGINILFNDSDGLDDYVTAKHNFSILSGISYERFDENGIKTLICSNCGAQSEENTAPLFICLGYSAPEDGRLSLAVEYKMDKDAVKEYKSVYSDFEYGVFAVLEKRIENNNFFDAEGNPISGTICAELSTENLTSVTLRIVGFSTDEQKELKLAMGVYTTESQEGALKHTFVQAKAPSQGDKYSFITYNEIYNG